MIRFATFVFSTLLLTGFSNISHASYTDFIQSQYGAEVTVPDKVLINGDFRSKKVLSDTETFDIRNYSVEGDSWSHRDFMDFEALEASLSEQVPGRHDLTNTVGANQDTIKFRVFVREDSSEPTSNQNSLPERPTVNRVMLMFNTQNDTFVGQSAWVYSPNYVLFKNRYERIVDDQYQMTDSMFTYISLQMKKEKPFERYDDKNKAVSRELAAQTGTWFDERIPLTQKSNIMKAPYFWGKYLFTDQAQVEQAKQLIANNESVRLDSSIFQTRLYPSIDALEVDLGQQVPLRPDQVNWLASAPSRYLVYIANPTQKQLPYEHMVHVYDGRSHEQYMTILWNTFE